jgi:ATP-dependent Clp protease adaptor protein ClpS
MSPQTLERPDTLTESEEKTEPDLPWNVILYNDDHHSFEAVILQVQKATGVSLERAYEITVEAHSKGRAVCYTGPLERCEHVADVLRQIKLTVEIEKTE